MTPSDDVMGDVQAVCFAELEKMSSTLRRVIRQRIACDDPSIIELAMTAYRDALAASALNKFLLIIEPLPNNLSRTMLMSLLAPIIGGIQLNMGLQLDEIADEVIHPPIDKLH